MTVNQDRRKPQIPSTLLVVWTFVAIMLLSCGERCFVSGYRPASLTAWSKRIQTGYRRRVAADPNFLSKSVTEVLVAAGTQLTAEWNRRGADRLLPEIDFVVPGILSAVAGKYYRYVVPHLTVVKRWCLFLRDVSFNVVLLSLFATAKCVFV